MLGLILIYFIGKQFYELAHEFNKHRWGFAILGVASYYAGTFLVGVALGLSDGLYETSFLDTSNTMMVNLAAVPFGLLACWLCYRLLKSKWSGAQKAGDTEILDDQVIP